MGEDLGFANPFGLHDVRSAVQNMGGQIRPGATPPPDRGTSWGDQNSGSDTSGIFYGSSQDKATTWRVHRNSTDAPNAAFAGQGNVSFNNSTAPIPFEER
jgi:hypothetical protein